LPYSQFKSLVTLRFADPRYLIVFNSGVVATTDEFTDEMAELLLKEQATIIFLEELSQIEADGEYTSIQDLDEIEWT